MIEDLDLYLDDNSNLSGSPVFDLATLLVHDADIQQEYHPFYEPDIATI